MTGAIGGSMGHDWIYDVLRDLKSYAEANGFGRLAAKAEETLQVAKAEIGGQGVQPEAQDTPGHDGR